ncbi:MAG: NAD-binding protein [Rhizobiales bacterium]|nr:NAD-binding protein [Hyphomicrobiales bacterium]
MSDKVSFIGLGVMGFPMAGHLARAGYDVCVYNRTSAKADKWLATYGGRAAATPAEAARDARIVFACVGNDDDVRAVTIGPDGAFSAMSAGAVFVDHTTASADVARELAGKAAAAGLGFLDAPVSGGQAGAENGQLTIMAGGAAADYAAAEKAMGHYARQMRLMGPSGSGQLTKMVNQICIAGLVEGLAEGLHFALRAGLDANAVIEVISKGAAQSWQMENRYKTMIESKYDFGFAVDWMRKDLAICLAEAARNGADLPVTRLVDQFYGEVQKAGGGRLDTSSLLTRYEPPGKPTK